MAHTRRPFLTATIILLGGLSACIAPSTASASATLQIVEGSKEFEKLVTTVAVSEQEDLYLQWTTDQMFAAGGTWLIMNVTMGNKVVASGEAGPAPAVGHFMRFTIAGKAFLQPSPPPAPVKFSITIVPHDKFNKVMGGPSAPVTVSQEPKGPPSPPTTFGRSALFPSVDIVTYDEKIGVVPQTQLHYAGADITVRIHNNPFIFKTTTDPMWLTIKDNSVLMRQNSPLRIPIPSLQPGQAETLSVHLDAILPPPTSQLPEDKQYSQWNQEYRDRCGVDLHAVLDWRGAPAQTPPTSHLETALLPNTPICDGKQCVRTCQIEKNIHAQLDGNVVGYSFFVGLYPKFGGYGQARMAANPPALDFTSKTRITVASVSKMVTAIAAVRILDKHGVSLDAPIGPFLPSDWSSPLDQPFQVPVTPYVRNITFAQLLGQRSGIKDYGNVPNDDAALQDFFRQPVSASTTTPCPTGPNATKPLLKGTGINPNDLTWCYSNYNFAILRLLLPRVAGFPEDTNRFRRPRTLADQYVKLVQQNVFDLVGQFGVACSPPGNPPGYAVAYLYPGNSAGYDWGDNSLVCGAAGWYLSVEDIARVLLSINAGDGKILTEAGGKKQFEIMQSRQLGWDLASPGELEKNGAWSANCDASGINCSTISTSIAIFGPVTGPRVIGVLFMNSNISGGPSDKGGARGVLEKAYSGAFFSK